VIKLQDHIPITGSSSPTPIASSSPKGWAIFSKSRFGRDLKIDYVVVSPIPGAHCGPDCIGVSFHAIHR
jgi:hypothetical protein